MKPLTIKALAELLNAELNGKDNFIINDVTTDSRVAKTGDCFFAIKGPNFDGHDYIDQAFEKGVVCAVVRKDFAADNQNSCLLKVQDTVRALGQLAAHYRAESLFKVIAITGSIGKTTTRHIIAHVLSQHYCVHQAPKNFNNFIGLPLAILGAEPDDQILVLELGSNAPGEIAYLSDIAKPNIAIITNIYPAHLQGFGDTETITKEKLSIAHGLQDGGTLIINGDCDQLLQSCQQLGLDFTTVGKSENCSIRASDIAYDGPTVTFTIDGTKVFLPLPGSANIENALSAWAVCSRFQISLSRFSDALKTLPPLAMRCQIIKSGTVTILNDCYNANPASMKNALETLAKLDDDPSHRQVFICGHMAELGPQSEKLHTELGRNIAAAGIELLITIGSLAKLTAEAASQAAQNRLETAHFDDCLSACNKLQNYIKDSDIVLVKGSRTAKLEMAVERLKQLFP